MNFAKLSEIFFCGIILDRMPENKKPVKGRNNMSLYSIN
jgi:hypothetical protein